MPSCSAIYNGGPCSAQKWKRRGNLTPFDCVRPTQKRIPPKNREKNTHPTVRTVWAPPIIAAIKCYSSSSFFRLKVSLSPPKHVFYFLPFRERKLFDPYRPCGIVGASVGMHTRSEGASFHIRLIWLPRPSEGNQRHNKSAAATAGPGLSPFVHAYLIFRKSCFSNRFLGKKPLREYVISFKSATKVEPDYCNLRQKKNGESKFKIQGTQIKGAPEIVADFF